MPYLIYFHTLLISLATSYTTAAREVSLGINTRVNKTERKMPIDTGSFVHLISKGVFVDKTLLINAILDDFSDTRTLVLTSPRKWGKSVNLNMLKTFLTIQVHPNGTRILPISSSPNYKLFTQGEYRSDDFDVKLEKPLLISNSKYRTVIDDHLGQHPVIHLSFAGFSSGSNKSHVERLSDIIASAFNEHKYLLNVYDHLLRHGNLLTYEAQFVESYLVDFKAFQKRKTVEEFDLQHAIETLCEQLYDCFEKKVYVLVDEYHELLDGTNVTRVLQNLLLSTTKNKDQVEKVILTGTLPVVLKTKAIFMGFLYSPVYTFYGFTKNETNLIYDFYQIAEKERAKMRHWYGGYQTPRNPRDEMFNPWSICNYINSRQLIPQWANSSFRDKYLDNICESSTFKNVLDGLIGGKNYDMVFTSSKFTHNELCSLNESSAKDISLRYLFATGFLTVKNTTTLDDQGLPVYTYGIPNYEITSYLANKSRHRME